VTYRDISRYTALTFLYFLAFCQPSFSRDFNFTLSTNALYARINDPRVEYAEEYQILKQPQVFIKSLSTGISFSPLDDKRFSINLSTNRLSNWQMHRKLRDKTTGTIYDYRTKTTLDSAYFGYRFGRFLPQLLITNLSVKKRLYYSDRLLSKDREQTVLFGASLGYLLTKNFMISGFIIAPNKALHLEGGLGAGAVLIF
jgi:hypothetical protein